MLTIIAAVAENNALGKDNRLLWHLPDDLKRFMKTTTGHHVIMGRKTFESLGKPLPKRTNIVITRNPEFTAPGIIAVSDIDTALELAKKDANPFILGGAEIYRQTLHLAQVLDITRVHHRFEADAFFPEIDPQIWKEVSNEFHPSDEKHPYDFSFLRYERIT